MSNLPKASEKLNLFYGGLAETLANFKKTLSPKVKEAHNTSGGFVRLREIGGTGDNNSQLFGRLSRKDIAPGDRVLVGYLESGEAIVLGRLHNSGEVDSPAGPVAGKNAGATVQAVATGFDFSTGLTAVADGVNAGEVDITFDITWGDARYIQRANPPYSPYGHLQTGRFVSILNQFALPALVGGAITANRAYYVPIFAPKSVAVQGITFNCSAVVSGNVRVGLYDMETGWLPTTQLAQSNVVALTSTGTKQIAFTAPYTVDAGRWYFAALVCSTASSFLGTGVVGGIPAARGGASGSYGEGFVVLAQQDLGSTTLPATANAGSSSTNGYIHLAGYT